MRTQQRSRLLHPQPTLSLLLLASICLAGCRGGEDNSGSDLPIEQPVDVSSPDSRDTTPLDLGPDGRGAIPDTGFETTTASWTVMIYLNGDNSLHYFALDDLVEIWSAGYSTEVHVVVLVDTYYEDAKEQRLGPSKWHVLDYPGELDMGDWTVLRDFTLRSIESFPAERYALIIWNHGDGWQKPSPPGEKAISQDVHGKAGVISVANGDLTAALQAVSETLGRPLDFLGFDACLMGMWEVAVALEGAADILLVSQETVPEDGWEYDDFFSVLNADPELEGAALAGVIADTYHSANDLSATISALSQTELLALNDAVDALGSVLLAASDDWDAVEAARFETQAFNLQDE